MGRMKERKLLRWINMMMALLVICHLSPITSSAQTIIRGNCLPDVTDGDVAAARGVRHLPAINTHWDADRIYPVAVVLIEASDTTFSVEEPHDFYNRIFNEHEYNERNGKGCVADYFRDQSNGLFNMEFHIYGPVKVSQPMRVKSGKNYGRSSFMEAVQMVIDSNPDVDFTQYDWDGNGYVEQVVIVYAGFGGNETNKLADGCIWPNTSSFNTVMAPGVKFSNYTASPELWASNSQSCGIGTICHEFSHSLGLPDLYPTSPDAGYSVVDEWDLMDGGNFCDRGWCPPNYSAHEKMLLGWMTPEELTEPAAINNLQPVAEGGKAYIVRTEGNPNEFFLIENRQWNGWDLRAPGHGLLICHVDYLASVWSGNTVNNRQNHRRYEYVPADNWNYDQWDTYISANTSTYYNGHNRHLSTTPYPYQTEDFLNNALTDSTIPAAVTFSAPGLLSKPITDIVENEDGTVSFQFMATLSGIVDVDQMSLVSRPSRRYDLQGRRVDASYRGLVICNGRLRLQ